MLVLLAPLKPLQVLVWLVLQPREGGRFSGAFGVPTSPSGRAALVLEGMLSAYRACVECHMG